MSQKTIWILVLIIVVVGGLWWYFGMQQPATTAGTDQSAAAANSAKRPSTSAAVNAVTQASNSLHAAGNSDAKVAVVQAQVRASVGMLGDLYAPLKLALQVVSASSRDTSAANAALVDYGRRLSTVQAAPVNGANAASIANNLDLMLKDVLAINAAIDASAR